jgi:hypothetical protein
VLRKQVKADPRRGCFIGLRQPDKKMKKRD